LDAVHARKLDVHQHEGRQELAGQAKPVLGRLRLHRAVALGLEHVAHQLPVLLVVLDDQDELGGHDLTGSVKVNVDPWPGWLLTQGRAAWRPDDRRGKARPQAGPSAFRREFAPPLPDPPKDRFVSSGAMPIPVSVTAISTKPSAGCAVTAIRPPSGVNLTALERRLRSTCLTFRSSPTSSPRRGSTVWLTRRPWRSARSRTSVRAFSRAAGRSNGASSSSMRPASTLDRSRM